MTHRLVTRLGQAYIHGAMPRCKGFNHISIRLLWSYMRQDSPFLQRFLSHNSLIVKHIMRSPHFTQTRHTPTCPNSPHINSCIHNIRITFNAMETPRPLNLQLIYGVGILVPFSFHASIPLSIFSLICKMISNPHLWKVPSTVTIIHLLSIFYLHKYLTKYYDFGSSKILISFHKYHNGTLASHRKLTKRDTIF